MNLDIDYAVKADIRNHPVVREIDVRQRRELRRIVWLTMLTVLLALLSALQNSRYIATHRRIEQLRLERADERIANRVLRASVEALERGEAVAAVADRLGMQTAHLEHTVILEREIDPMPVEGVLARAD